jgi:hypothetical protein
MAKEAGISHRFLARREEEPTYSLQLPRRLASVIDS